MDLMKTLSGMYEKSSANNKVHMINKLLNLKKAKGILVALHLKEFNTSQINYPQWKLNLMMRFVH